MKKLLLVVATIMSFVSTNAQTIAGDYLDINNVKARVNSDGSLFWDFVSGQFEAPKGSNRHTIYYGDIWVGGYDSGGILKTAISEFWPGPLTALGTTDSTTIYNFNKVWKINQCDINTYLNWFNGGQIGTNPTDSIAMSTILNWPTLNPTGGPLAPYIDANLNGVYDPYTGDSPQIKGDQAVFFVFNDNGGPHFGGGISMSIEVQVMAYAYGCSNDSALNNTVFTSYKIINKGGFRLDSTFIGNYTDFDIGSYSDDYVGSDVMRGTYYGYNGDLVDDNPPAGQLTYGINPPAQGVVFLAGPYADPNGLDDAILTTPNGTNYGDLIVDNERLGMSKFVSYDNTSGVTGYPFVASDAYNYMAGTWKDATPFSYGGTGHLSGAACDYMFPGVSDPLGFGTNMTPQTPWDETTTGTTPGDRRGLGSFGPFTFQPGAVHEIDFAYVYGRATSGGNLASVVVMQERIDSIRQKFNNGITGCGCASLTGINNISQNDNLLSIYPNPASENININFTSTSKNISIKIFDATGRLIKNMENVRSGENTINVSELESGLYLINANDGKSSVTKRFVKQ